MGSDPSDTGIFESHSESNVNEEFPYYTVPSEPIRSYTFFEQVKAVITFDEKVLKSIPKDPNSLNIAGFLIIISMFLDFFYKGGFNFRLTITFNGTLSPFYFLVQPLSLLYLAVVMDFTLRESGNQQNYTQVFIMIGYAHIWTFATALVFLFQLNFSNYFSILYFLVSHVVYFSTIVISLVDGNRTHKIKIGTTLIIISYISLILPFLFLALILG